MTVEEAQRYKLPVEEASEKVIVDLKEALPRKEKHFHSEIALWHVDNLLLGTHDKKSMLEDLNRRFGKMTIHENGCVFLGHDIIIEKEQIILKMKTHVERAVENLTEKGPENLAMSSLVGMLNWATSCVFGTHQKEARILASNANLELQEDLETALALIYELYEKREQGIYFRDY